MSRLSEASALALSGLRFVPHSEGSFSKFCSAEAENEDLLPTVLLPFMPLFP
jgi:hypothetical protein